MQASRSNGTWEEIKSRNQAKIKNNRDQEQRKSIKTQIWVETRTWTKRALSIGHFHVWMAQNSGNGWTIALNSSTGVWHRPSFPCILSHLDYISLSRTSTPFAIFFLINGVTCSIATHRSFHQLMNPIVLGVMFLSCLSLLSYLILALRTRASSLPDEGLGSGGW